MTQKTKNPMTPKHHIVFLTGAGISQESGISTFRDAKGLWNNHKIEEVASPEGFEKNPQLVLDFFKEYCVNFPMVFKINLNVSIQ